MVRLLLDSARNLGTYFLLIFGVFYGKQNPTMESGFYLFLY
jgi:hypothetical protein